MSKKEDDKNKKNAFQDPVLSVIGDFGKFQGAVCVLHALATVPFMWQLFANKFLASQPDFPPGIISNFSNGNLSIKVDNGNINGECDSMDFSHATYQNTVVERFDLSCNESKHHLLRLAQSLFFVGTTIGALVCGPLCDLYGRNLIFVSSTALCGASTAVELFAPNYFVWTAGRVLAGVMAMSSNISANIYRTEVFGGKWRSIGNAIGSTVPAQLGLLAMALFVFLVPNLIFLEVALVGMGLLISVPCWFFIPESPRWLMVKGRNEKALKVMKRIAKINGLNMDEYMTAYSENLLKEDANSDSDKESGSKDSERKGPTFKEIFTGYPGLRRNLIVCILLWYAFSLGYFGMLYNTPPLGFNPQLVFAFPAFLTLPVLSVSPFLENHLGRRPLIMLAMSVGGLSGMLAMAIPYDWNGVTIILCTITTVLAFETLNVTHTYTKEIFPTVIRGTAFGLSSMFSRLGSVSAPLLMYLTPPMTPMDSPLTRLPMAAYGACMIIAAILCLWLWPETAWINVVDSLEEGEAAASSYNPWTAWCCFGRHKQKDPLKHSVEKGEAEEDMN